MLKAASIEDLKKELQHLPPGKVMELVLRMARFKKENKELLSYLLFESAGPSGYIQSIMVEIEEQMAIAPTDQRVSEKKKRLRRILRTINRHTKYIGTKEAHVELLQSFCQRFAEHLDGPHVHPGLVKIYLQQLKKISQLLPALPEDLAHDYERWLLGLPIYEKVKSMAV
jgi:hypothetical protein